jgi:hypothetical protein
MTPTLIRFSVLLALTTAGCGIAPTPAADPQAHGHDHSRHQHFTEVPADLANVTDVGISFRSQVVPVLRTHCAGCHTEGGEGAAHLMMFDGRGEPQHAVIRGAMGRMLLEIQAGRMPKGRPNSLTLEEFKTLDSWGATEMPDN